MVPALFASVAEFTQPDEGVILFTPVYHPFYMAVEENNRALVECPLVLSEGPHYDIDFDLLEKLAAEPKNTMIILCSPHNPSGRVWTKEELTRIAEIASFTSLLVNDHSTSDFSHTQMIFKDLNCLYNSSHRCSSASQVGLEPGFLGQGQQLRENDSSLASSLHALPKSALKDSDVRQEKVPLLRQKIVAVLPHLGLVVQ